MRASRGESAGSRARQVLGLASVAFLVAFHAVLLWERLADATLFQPVPAIRWLATIALVLALYKLHRNGVSLLRGRGALVIWLLVLLLHVSFLGVLAEATLTSEGWSGPGLLLALPALTIILGAAHPALRRFLARLLGASEPRHLPSVRWLSHSPTFAERAGFLPALACRPPPAR